jgi:hypothetical protein
MDLEGWSLIVLIMAFLCLVIALPFVNVSLTLALALLYVAGALMLVSVGLFVWQSKRDKK